MNLLFVIFYNAMEPWIEFNTLVYNLEYRFGYFSFNHLTQDEQHRFKYHPRALGLWKTFGEDIPPTIRNITSCEVLKLVDMLGLSNAETKIMNQYTIHELRHLCYRNHVAWVMNKKYKKSWARAYLSSKRWSFNVFAMRSKLHDDLLREIKCWL